MPKNKTDNKTVEIKMGTLDVQTNIIVPGIRLKSLSTKNEYGTSQLFHVLENNFKTLISRREP